MNLTTRCPACATTFKVVPDQLKISEGWVRCGHCADVFDATLYLETWTAPVQAEPEPEPVVDALSEPDVSDGSGPDPAGAEPQAASFTSDHIDEDMLLDTTPSTQVEALSHDDEGEWLSGPVPLDVVADAGDLSGVDLGPFDEWLSSEDGNTSAPPSGGLPSAPLAPEKPLPVQAAARPLPAPVDDSGDPSDFHAELKNFAAGLGKSAAVHDAPSTDPVQAASKAVAAVPGAAPQEVPSQWSDIAVPEGETSVQAAEPGFVRQARRRAFWQSAGMRSVLALLALVLAVLLAGQWTLHERDRLAAWQPGWAPVLERLCEPLGCKLAPVRRIDAVVIDSSALVRRLGNFYSFDLVLKNTADITLAVPALELTLTDTRDEVIARRIFTPEQFPGTPVSLAARSSLSVNLRLSIVLADASPMAGYRALIFYP